MFCLGQMFTFKQCWNTLKQINLFADYIFLIRLKINYSIIRTLQLPKAQSTVTEEKWKEGCYWRMLKDLWTTGIWKPSWLGQLQMNTGKQSPVSDNGTIFCIDWFWMLVVICARILIPGFILITLSAQLCKARLCH